MDPLKFAGACCALLCCALSPVCVAEPPAAAATSSGTLTLKQCMDAAYGLSPALRAEKFDINAAGEELVRQRTALLPNVSFSGYGGLVDGYPLSLSTVTGQGTDSSLSNGITPTTAFRNAATSGTGTGRGGTTASKDFASSASWAPYGVERIQLNYALFQNGSILGLNDAPTIAGTRAAKEGLEWTRQLGEAKVVFDLCNAFFITQWFQLKVARDEATVHFSEQRVEITQMLFKLQLKLQQDVDLAKAMLVADQQMLTATKQSVRDSYAVLALLIGRPATPVLRLDAKRPSFSTLPPLQDLLRIAREKHPSVGVQRSVADYAVAKLRLDQAGLLPQATFNTNYAVGENFAELAASNANTPTRYAAGVSVSVPIFDWGSQLAQVRESRVKLEAEKARLAQVQMDVSTALARLYDTEHNLEQQLSTEIATQVSTENSARLAREQRTAGVVDQLTLANAEINLLTAEGITEATRLLELQNYAALQQAAGGVWSWVQ